MTPSGTSALIACCQTCDLVAQYDATGDGRGHGCGVAAKNTVLTNGRGGCAAEDVFAVISINLPVIGESDLLLG